MLAIGLAVLVVAGCLSPIETDRPGAEPAAPGGDAAEGAVARADRTDDPPWGRMCESGAETFRGRVDGAFRASAEADFWTGTMPGIPFEFRGGPANLTWLGWRADGGAFNWTDQQDAHYSPDRANAPFALLEFRDGNTFLTYVKPQPTNRYYFDTSGVARNMTAFLTPILRDSGDARNLTARWLDTAKYPGDTFHIDRGVYRLEVNRTSTFDVQGVMDGLAGSLAPGTRGFGFHLGETGTAVGTAGPWGAEVEVPVRYGRAVVTTFDEVRMERAVQMNRAAPSWQEVEDEIGFALPAAARTNWSCFSWAPLRPFADTDATFVAVMIDGRVERATGPHTPYCGLHDPLRTTTAFETDRRRLWVTNGTYSLDLSTTWLVLWEQVIVDTSCSRFGVAHEGRSSNVTFSWRYGAANQTWRFERSTDALLVDGTVLNDGENRTVEFHLEATAHEGAAVGSLRLRHLGTWRFADVLEREYDGGLFGDRRDLPRPQGYWGAALG